MVLGKLPVPGRPTILITVGQGPTALAVGAGGSGLDIFTLDYPFSPLSPSLWEKARYRLKYCLKGPLNQKQQQQQLRKAKIVYNFGLSECNRVNQRYLAVANLLHFRVQIMPPFRKMQCRRCLIV